MSEPASIQVLRQGLQQAREERDRIKAERLEFEETWADQLRHHEALEIAEQQADAAVADIARAIDRQGYSTEAGS